MTVRQRMRSTTAVLCAVVLGLGTACSADPAPSPAPVTSPPASTTPTTPTTSSSPTSSRTTTSATAAALDAASITWFKSFCTEFAGLAQIGSTNSTAGATSDTPKQKQEKLSAELDTAASAFDNVAMKLSSAPPPGIANGQAVATGVITGLKDIATFIRDAGAEFKAAPVTDEASLAAAQKATEDKMAGIGTFIQQKILVPLAPAVPSLQGSAAQLPECAALGS